MRLLAFLFLAILVTDCCPKVVTKRTVDTVYVKKPVPIPEKTGFFNDVILSDTIIVENPDIEFKLLPVDKTKRRIEYRIKKDTIKVYLPQETITNTIVKEKKVTAWWSYLVLGAGILIALLALLRR